MCGMNGMMVCVLCIGEAFAEWGLVLVHRRYFATDDGHDEVQCPADDGEMGRRV